MAKYSESDKLSYLKAKKKGKTKLPFGTWLKNKTVNNAASYSDSLQKVYEMSNTSKKNRGKLPSSKKERP